MSQEKNNSVIDWIMKEKYNPETGQYSNSRLVWLIGIGVPALLAGMVELYAQAHDISWGEAAIDLFLELIGG